MATTTKDGYTRNDDGTISYKGKNLGAISLSAARNQTGGKSSGSGTNNTNPMKVNPKAFTAAQASYQADYGNNPAWIGQAALGSNSNISNPFGGQTTTIDPKTGQAITNYTLSDANQNVVNQLQGNAGSAGANQGNLLNSGVFNGYSGNPQTDPYTQAVFNQLVQPMQAQFKQQIEDKKQELYNRGIPAGSDQFAKEMGQLSQQQNQFYNQASNQAVTSGASMQNQAANTLQGITQAGYMSPNWQQSVGGWNPNMYTNATQVGQVFGTLANQNLSAQAQMAAAKAAGMQGMAALQNSDINGALTNWMVNQQQGYNPNNPTQPGAGTNLPTQ